MAEDHILPKQGILSRIAGNRQFQVSFFFVFSFFVAIYSQILINRLRPAALPPSPEKAENPLLARLLGSSSGQLAADLYWANTLLILKGNVTPDDGERLQRALDLVVTLDPRFYPAYFYGGLILSTRAGNPDLADPFLVKGSREFPGDWQIPFLLGWNCYSETNDFSGAVRWMKESAARPEAPPWLAQLGPEFLRLEENPALLPTDFPPLAARAGGEWIRTYWGGLLPRLIILRDLEALNRMMAKFKEKFQAYPGSLDELVWNGLLEKIPAHPLGGSYFIDAQKKKVYSSVN